MCDPEGEGLRRQYSTRVPSGERLGLDSRSIDPLQSCSMFVKPFPPVGSFL